PSPPFAPVTPNIASPPLAPPPSPPPPPPPPPSPPPPPPPPCQSDTIWAAPRTPGEGPPATNTTAYRFTSAAPTLVAQSAPIIFTWNPIQKLISTESKWGGYFTIPVPPVANPTVSYTTITPPDSTSTFGCAGCAKNDPRRGYNVGGIVLRLQTVNSTLTLASCAMTISNNANKTITVDSGHFYASYAPLTSFAPGSFPTSTITGLPGAESTTVTMSQRVGGTKPSGTPPVYLACHFTVNAC
ncbi:hypothetical protein HYH03_016935, partial [Edaphochlamys debaryana]